MPGHNRAVCEDRQEREGIHLLRAAYHTGPFKILYAANATSRYAQTLIIVNLFRFSDITW